MNLLRAVPLLLLSGLQLPVWSALLIEKPEAPASQAKVAPALRSLKVDQRRFAVKEGQKGPWRVSRRVPYAVGQAFSWAIRIPGLTGDVRVRQRLTRLAESPGGGDEGREYELVVPAADGVVATVLHLGENDAQGSYSIVVELPDLEIEEVFDYEVTAAAR